MKMTNTISIISGLITIFVFITGISSLTYAVRTCDSELSEVYKYSNSIILISTLLLFGISHFIQIKIARILYKNRMLTVGTCFHETQDYAFVFFFGVLGCCIIFFMAENFWSLEIEKWNLSEKIIRTIYFILFGALSFVMAKAAKIQGC